jgi:hypothetical protein
MAGLFKPWSTSGGLSAVIKEETRSDKSSEEVLKAVTDMSRGNLPVAKQVELLTKKYGKYAIFSIAERIVLTPEQVVEKDSIQRDYEDQVLSILTLEQKEVYQANILIKRCLETRLKWT